MKLQLVLVCLMCVASTIGLKTRYDNYKLFSFTLDNVEQFKALQQLEENSDSYDFWSGPHMEREITVMVAPHKFGEFDDLLAKLNIDYVITNENVQNDIDAEEAVMNNATRNGISAIDWTRFYTFADINAWLDGRVTASPFLTNRIIGTSAQGRPLRCVIYSERSNNPGIFIEANIHAREWASSATATYLINELISSTDQATRAMANTIDWYICPIANPDGFVFSHTTTRLWRKTRSSNAGSTCIGTDPNRNFDFFWNGGGSSTNPCSDTYHGSRAFSELETAAIRDFYGGIASRVRIFLSFHAFGQYLLHSYGHTSTPSPNHANLQSVARATCDAIEGTFGSDYVFGPTASTLYIASGSSPDWAFGRHNTLLAYTFEFRLRRGSSNGFVLPPAQIIPNCQEVMNGIKAMVAQARVVGQL